MRKLLSELESRREDMIRLLDKFVRCESPSHEKAAVDRFGAMVLAEWRRRGANVRLLRQSRLGNHVHAELWRGDGSQAGQILVLGHLDTVYPLGSLAKMPFRISGGRAWGPGAFDMKAGLVLALFAVDALRAAGHRPQKRVVLFWNSDEEIGSETSRRAIEREALRSDAVLVLEPSFGREGRLKTARKGVGSAEIIIRGRAAHAGINPGSGVNAVHELALQIERLMKMNDPGRGITVQATVVAGGTVSNVIPDLARAETMVNEVLARSPYRVALVASSSWSHAFLSPKNGYLWPDHEGDRLLFDAISRADWATWRKRSLAEMEYSGQHEMLNWMALAGAMEALDRKPPVIQDYMETYILASDKCFLSFPA